MIEWDTNVDLSINSSLRKICWIDKMQGRGCSIPFSFMYACQYIGHFLRGFIRNMSKY